MEKRTRKSEQTERALSVGERLKSVTFGRLKPEIEGKSFRIEPCVVEVD